MKRLLVLLLAAVAYGQQNQLTLQQGSPPPVSSISATYTGTVQGGSQIFYWVVARYPRGAVQATGPAVASNTPGSANLTAGNLVTISWSSMPGASSYDVVRANTANYPANPSCTCAVVLATTATTTTDTGAALSAYPPSTLVAAGNAGFNLQINNRDATLPYLLVDLTGYSTLRWPLLSGVFTLGQTVTFDANGNFVSTAFPAGGITSINTLTALAQLMTVGTAGTDFAIAQSGLATNVFNLPTASAANRGALSTTDWSTFNGKQGAVQTGTFAALPGTCTDGSLYFPNNSAYLLRCLSNAWVPWGPIFPFTSPLIPSFTTVNAGTNAATNGFYYLSTVGTGGYNWRMRVITAPVTPYSITVAFSGDTSSTTTNEVYNALVWRESGSGKIASCGWGETQDRKSSYKWTDASNFSAAYTSATTQSWASSGPGRFIRITDDGANRICSYATDGVNFITFHTVGRTDFLTADQVGFGINTNAASPIAVGMTVLSWLQQ